jgi:hypothetical protein
MQLDEDSAKDLAEALERQIKAQGEAAKLAIREYKNTILRDSASARPRQAQTKRDVERAVDQYMQLCKKLDELRAQTNARQLPVRTG